MAKEGEQIGVWPVYGHNDFDLILSVNPDWESAGTNWFYVCKFSPLSYLFLY